MRTGLWGGNTLGVLCKGNIFGNVDIIFTANIIQGSRA